MRVRRLLFLLTLFKKDPNSAARRKEAGIGGTVVGIGLLMLFAGLLMSFRVRVFTELTLMLVLIGVGVVVVGFILLPGMKKDATTLRDEEAGHVRYDCEFCGAALKFEPITQTYVPCPHCSKRKNCPQCGTSLIHNEVAQVYDCPYCHVGFGVGDL
jgi:DNA-directed RNA polymerase subunit RPC12/RpoP